MFRCDTEGGHFDQKQVIQSHNIVAYKWARDIQPPYTPQPSPLTQPYTEKHLKLPFSTFQLGYQGWIRDRPMDEPTDRMTDKDL